MGAGLLRRFAAVTAVVAASVCVSAQQKQPAVNTAALAKLAEPWPSPEEMEARRLAAERRPLFADVDPVEFTLTADFKKINKDRRVEGKIPYPATLTIPGDGGPKTIQVTLKTRGHFRLRATSCEFVPLRVEFPKDDVKGTIFDGQKALKLITHCQSEREYEQYVMREYLAYRAFNLLTPKSFRARLARPAYTQSTDNKPVIAEMVALRAERARLLGYGTFAHYRLDEGDTWEVDLEWLFRAKPEWKEIAQGVLFKEGDIVEHGEEAEEEAD